MCDRCAAEYGDPANRRFHAQPNACDICGPHLGLLDGDGNPMSGDPIQEAVRILQNGGILAVKGLGGKYRNLNRPG
jgi:hydrogenase maturation protein HypF